MRPIYPLPEVFPGEQGSDWKVRQNTKDTHDIVDFDERVIYAPLEADPVSNCSRLQQIGRVKWDDGTDVSEFDDSILFRAVEDHRISFLLDRAGVDIRAGFLSEKIVEKLMAGGPSTATAGLLLTDYTDDRASESMLKENATTKPVQLFLEARRRIQENPTKANTVAIVRWLLSQVKDTSVSSAGMGNGKGFGKKGMPGGHPGSKRKSGTFDEFFDSATEDLGEDEWLKEIPADVRQELPRESPSGITSRTNPLKSNQLDLVPWGDMSIHEPARVETVQGRFYKKWRSTEEGVFPRYPHRLLTDGRVFARRHKVPGGTVVIDASGSMGLTPQAIEQIVVHAPGCTVAAYSGGVPDITKGVLRILAKDGRRVRADFCSPPGGSGNIVDFPALLWAYKLAHPRVWVSDLGVTGHGDQTGTANLVMCHAVVKKGKFFHAPHVGEAVRILKTLGRFYKK